MRSFPWKAIVLVPAIGLATSADAGTVLEPSGLSVGDKYRLVFVTSTKRDATSSNIADYNSFVDAIGDTLTAGDWTALASTSTVNAQTNTSTGTSDESVAIYNLNNEIVSNNYSGLWSGNLQNDIYYDELGGTHWNDQIWTGTASNGFGSSNSTLGGTGNAAYGFARMNDSNWIRLAYNLNKTTEAHFYALSGILTYGSLPPAAGSNAVPGPVALGALAFVGLGRVSRRRRG